MSSLAHYRCSDEFIDRWLQFDDPIATHVDDNNNNILLFNNTNTLSTINTNNGIIVNNEAAAAAANNTLLLTEEHIKKGDDQLVESTPTITTPTPIIITTKPLSSSSTATATITTTTTFIPSEQDQQNTSNEKKKEEEEEIAGTAETRTLDTLIVATTTSNTSSSPSTTTNINSRIDELQLFNIMISNSNTSSYTFDNNYHYVDDNDEVDVTCSDIIDNNVGKNGNNEQNQHVLLDIVNKAAEQYNNEQEHQDYFVHYNNSNSSSPLSTTTSVAEVVEPSSAESNTFSSSINTHSNYSNVQLLPPMYNNYNMMNMNYLQQHASIANNSSNTSIPQLVHHQALLQQHLQQLVLPLDSHSMYSSVPHSSIVTFTAKVTSTNSNQVQVVLLLDSIPYNMNTSILVYNNNNNHDNNNMKYNNRDLDIVIYQCINYKTLRHIINNSNIKYGNISYVFTMAFKASLGTVPEPPPPQQQLDNEYSNCSSTSSSSSSSVSNSPEQVLLPILNNPYSYNRYTLMYHSKNNNISNTSNKYIPFTTDTHMYKENTSWELILCDNSIISASSNISPCDTVLLLWIWHSDTNEYHLDINGIMREGLYEHSYKFHCELSRSHKKLTKAIILVYYGNENSSSSSSNISNGSLLTITLPFSITGKPRNGTSRRSKKSKDVKSVNKGNASKRQRPHEF